MLESARQSKMKVLSLFGVNPVRNGAAGSDEIREALQNTPFVVVSDLFMTETAGLATLVLPAKGAFEKSGTTMNLAGDLLPVNQSLEAPAGTLSDLEMLIGFAQQFNVALPSLEELEAAVIAAAAKPFDGGFGDKLFGAPLRTGRRRFRPQALHLGRRRNERSRRTRQSGSCCARRQRNQRRRYDRLGERLMQGLVNTFNAAPVWLVILIKSAVLLLVVVTTFAYAMLAERKVLGWMQLASRTKPRGSVGSYAAGGRRGKAHSERRSHAEVPPIR